MRRSFFLQRGAEFSEGIGNKLQLANPRTRPQPIENQDHPMKTLSLLAAMFLTAALAGPAAEAGRIPFNGTMEASESYTDFGQPPILFFVNAGGTANTANLGQFTLAYTFMVDYMIDPSPGRALFKAANGDNLFTVSTGVGSSTPDPNVSSIVEMHTITGGTGQFADAKGDFTVHRLVTFGPGGATGTTSGSFNGSIIVRGHH